MNQHIVTHCLAIWNTYANTFIQEDKDFFDTRLDMAMHASNSTQDVVETLIRQRLIKEKYTPQEAEAISKRLVQEHIQKLSQQMQPIIVETPQA